MNKLLGGRYELEEPIGGGGMAVVYRAVDKWLGRVVAVKMLRPQFAGDDEFVNRFRNEAQAAAKLSHPNIVSLYDIGMTGSEYYIVMEYVDGPTLKDVIRERAPLAVPKVVDLTGQICGALQHAHSHGIIHRDIKPHNILLTKSGQAKVTDFGIARAVTGNTISYHDATTSVLGSVHYFSPEQARGGTTDEKSDIYSLGVVMYEMLTGDLPFSGETPVSVALKHLRDRFVEPRELNPDIPQGLENIVLRCLVKSAELRYPNMSAVQEDLKFALTNPNQPKFVMPAEAPDATIVIPAVGGLSAVDGESGSARDKPARKQAWWRVLFWWFVGIVLLGVVLYAAYFIIMDLIQVPNATLPNVVHETDSQAIQTLEKNGFAAAQIHEQSGPNSSPAGTVYAQDPPGPTSVKATRQITLYVSSGPPKIAIPVLQGEPVDQAIVDLENQGFPAANITEQQVQSSQIDTGSVVNSNPPAGSMVTADTQIVLMVSQGSEAVIPKVVGLTLTQAEQALLAANLKYGQIYRVAFNAPDQTVFDIQPYKQGQKVPTGTAIPLWVADNSGESGGGLGIDNSAGNSTGGTLPSADTVAKPVQVTVNDPQHQPIAVQIYTTDSEGTRTLFVDQMISQTSSWSVTLFLTPSTPNGEVLVYENAVLKQDVKASYSQ